MKKTFILALAVAFVVGGMFVGNAQAAGVGDTYHDLSIGSWSYSGTWNASAPYTDDNNDFTNASTSQMCVFCHHPHRSTTNTTDTDVFTNDVLWNQIDQSVDYSVYTSDSIDGLTASVTGTSGMRTYLCMACHDGDIAANSLVATPGDGVNVPAQVSLTGGDLDQGAGVVTELEDDHPVNILYNSGSGLGKDSGLETTITGTKVSGTYPLFSGYVQCATCHDVHDSIGTASTGVQFMRTAGWQTSSSICTDCHTNK